MPRQFAPKKSGVHLLACLSLYRALLRECGKFSRAVTFKQQQQQQHHPAAAVHHHHHPIKGTLRSIVRWRFDKDRDILSPPQVANGLAAGYGFLDLLRSCTAGSTQSLVRLTQTLETMSTRAEETTTRRAKFASSWKPPPAHHRRRLEHFRKIKDPANYEHDPSDPRIFHHPAPLASIKSGVRKVPNLIVTQGIPVLKYPGPQPVLINRVIKNKVKWGVKKFNQHKMLEDLRDIAECEDEWDDIVRNRHGVDKRGREGEEKWVQSIREADSHLERRLAEQMKKNTELSGKFHEIVLAERELKEKERREARHQRRMARKKRAVEESGAVETTTIPAQGEHKSPDHGKTR